jgi:hypothetical protein
MDSTTGAHVYRLFRDFESAGSCHFSERDRKALGTQISRMQHFYKFVSHVLKLEDITLNSLTLKAANEVMLLYTFTLQASDTIQGRPVKADTLLGYLQAASAYMRLIGRRDACPLHHKRDGDTSGLRGV